MISFDAAIGLIETKAVPLGVETVALDKAAGRVLAAPIYARSDAPRFPVAAMDGYAVIDAATQPNKPNWMIGESHAGAGFAGVVTAGQAVRIFTGAPMPAGADRCIMQEYAVRDGDTVRFSEGYGSGFHVRAAGSDFTAGALLLEAGVRLMPRAMIAAAAADVASLTVALRPRIAIIGTGDELARPGEAHLRSGAIPESVTHGVSAMGTQAGARITVRMIGLDNLSALEAAADSALDAADLVVITGGASVGERDFAKPMFAAHGLELVFSTVAIKPGKPVWLGRSRRKWVLGLPGNPTSAMVTARLFLLPLLACLQGQSTVEVLRWRKLSLANRLGATSAREAFVRARWDFAGLTPLNNQDSGTQSPLAEADWLIRCPPHQRERAVGNMVSALSF